MAEVQPLVGPEGGLPALGPGTWVTRPSMLRRLAVVALVLLALLGAKIVVGALEQNNSLGLLTNAKQLTPWLLVGAAPTDAGTQALASNLNVDGVVDLTGASMAVRASAAFLHMGFIRESLNPGEAPTAAQLQDLVAFVSRFTAGGKAVYLYDDTGGGRALVTADMLWLMKGGTWQEVRSQMSRADWRQLSSRQVGALNRVRAAANDAGARA